VALPLVPGVATLAGWIGWPALVGFVGLLVAAVVAVNVWIRRYKRAVANPFRAILAVDRPLGRRERTVIADAETVLPAQAGPREGNGTGSLGKGDASDADAAAR
jgi:hypothetical protein